MRITEIYASIQGETQYAGLPCTLVRTTGCDLRCSYCDTSYAFAGGREMSVDDIVLEVRRLGLPWVTLTGGEPMLQAEMASLAERLVREGFRVALETSGAHPVAHLSPAVIRIVDIKTPGSGEVEREISGTSCTACGRRMRSSSCYATRPTTSGQPRWCAAAVFQDGLRFSSRPPREA
jgi:7-carboxy-7-deazaguanine synthase